MTTRETKLIALSAAAGILTGVLVLALLGERGKHFFADAPAVAAAQPASAGQPLASPASALGTQPGATVELSPAEITAAGVQVAEVRTASLKTDIDAFGRVEQPEAQLAATSTALKLLQRSRNIDSRRRTAMDFTNRTTTSHARKPMRW